MAQAELARSRAATISTAKGAAHVEIENAWRSGNLRCLLQSHQLPVYDKIQSWIANPPDSVALGALYDSMFLLDIARRFGKTGLCLVILYEWGLKLPPLIGRGAILTYATREKDQIKRIVLPLHRLLTRHAPDDRCPQHFGSHEGMGEGLYFPPDAGGSIIKLVGVDKDPHRLRGEGSDGGVFSEAAHMKDLHENITSVFLPQFQQRPWARLILESTAPEQPDHDFDEHFVPDAKKRGAYVFGTIDDNTSLSQADKERALRESGGKDSHVAQREYYGKRHRDPERTVIPEYNEARHARRIERPAHACGFVFQDPGHRDLFGIVWAYWHYELDVLVCMRSWAKRNASTVEVAQVILETNAELFDGFGWWDGPVQQSNPALHVSDVDPRLQHDLNAEYDMRVVAADKSRAGYGVGEARLYKLRDGFAADKIVIDSRDPGPLREHVSRARWNENRTDLERHKVMGHYDCMMALLYGWGRLGAWRNRNPNPPIGGIYTGRESDRVFGPNYVPPTTQREREAAAIFGKDFAAHRHPAPGLVAPKRPPLSKCGICCKWRRCETWMEAGGSYVCSIECSDKWTYRATGGKPPEHVLAARARAATPAPRRE